MIRKDYDIARDILLTAIQIDPEYADAYLRLGVVFSEQELFEEASEQFKKSTEYDLKNHDAWFRYASSLNAIDNFSEAFIASANRDIIPVVSIDNHTIGDGKVGLIYKKLISLYQKEILKNTV